MRSGGPSAKGWALVDAGHKAWLTARRAWSDAAGPNLEPVDGV
jgi:hypothetical protein